VYSSRKKSRDSGLNVLPDSVKAATEANKVYERYVPFTVCRQSVNYLEAQMCSSRLLPFPQLTCQWYPLCKNCFVELFAYVLTVSVSSKNFTRRFCFYHGMHITVRWYRSSWKPISELRRVTCHTGSQSITRTCHPTQVNVPCLNPSQTGQYLTYLPHRDGRLSRP